MIDCSQNGISPAKWSTYQHQVGVTTLLSSSKLLVLDFLKLSNHFCVD